MSLGLDLRQINEGTCTEGEGCMVQEEEKYYDFCVYCLHRNFGINEISRNVSVSIGQMFRKTLHNCGSFGQFAKSSFKDV